jgi:hypothetical protein
MRALPLLLLPVLAVPAGAHAAYREPEVRAAATAAGFGDIADRVARAARPTVTIHRELLRRMPRTLGTSRLGGLPDLPAGEPWPRCRGRAQTFVGQVRLRDLPAAARELRRHHGRLLIFTHVELEGWWDTSYGLWAGDCTTVVHANLGRRLVRTPPPRGRANPTLRLRPARMRFRARTDLPDLKLDEDRLSPPLHAIRVGDDRVAAWWGLRDALNHLPRDGEHRLLGYVDSPNGENGCSQLAQRRTQPWRLLATISWDEGVHFEVADSGRLQIAIAPRDLRSGRFDRVCSSFDSA